MDAWVERVTSFTGRPAELAASLKADVNSGLLRQHAMSLPNVLATLDPAAYSLGWLFAANALASTPGSAPDYRLVMNFLKVCSAEEIRAAPETFVSLARKMKQWAVGGGKPKLAVAPLRAALRKLQPSVECLTPLHAEFFQVCLLSRCYYAAAPILKEEIYDVAPDVCTTTPRDFLLYAYYGGMLCIGSKEYDRALDLLQYAITAPTTVVSAIAVAAYQKYVLVQLIHNGNCPPLPKYTSTIIHRYVKSECVIYADLAHAFSRNSTAELSLAVTSNQSAFRADGNWGLVKQCQEALQRRNVGRLTHTHLTLSLQGIADTAKLAGPEAAEALILSMVQSGEIWASINPVDGMVSFNEDPERYCSADIAEYIDAQIRRSMALDARLQAVNEAVSCDKAYLSKTLAKEVRPDSSRLGDEEHMDVVDERNPVAPMYTG